MNFSPADPQFMYLIIILPVLFGLTLILDGVIKIVKKDKTGWISMFAGIIFTIFIAAAFMLISPTLLK